MAKIAILNEKPSQLLSVASIFKAKPQPFKVGSKNGLVRTVNYQGDTLYFVNTIGHLYEYDTQHLEKMVSPAQEERYKSWDLGNLPWHESDFDWSKKRARSGVSNQLNLIKAVFAACDEISIMTDVDPTGEGQLLAWEIIDGLNMNHKKITRIYFYDEDDGPHVLKAYQERVTLPTMMLDPDFKMSFFRQRWDFLSMQFSRISRNKGDGKTALNQGRLKSACIKLVGDRLKAIAEYQKIPFYQAKFKDTNGNVFTDPNADVYKTSNDVPIGQFGRSAIKLESTTTKRSGPEPLLTFSKLSYELEKKGYAASEIKKTYQALYEAKPSNNAELGGYVTYPRTEDKFINQDQFNKLLPYIDEIADLVGVDKKLLSHRTPRKTHIKEGGTHGANRPGRRVPKNLNELSQYGPSAIDIYILLARNYLAMLAEDYTYERQTAIVEKYPTFKSSISVPKKLGWKQVFSTKVTDALDTKAFGLDAEPFVHEGFPPKPSQPTSGWLYDELDRGSAANKGKKHQMLIDRTNQIKALLQEKGVKMKLSGIGTGATQLEAYTQLTSTRKRGNKVVSKPMFKTVKGKIALTHEGQMSYELLPDTVIGSLELTELVYVQMVAIKAGILDANKCLDEIEVYVKHDLNIMERNSQEMRKKLNVKVVDMADTKEREVVLFDGQEWNVAREWGGHRFDDTEWDTLKNGGQIQLNLVSKAGNPYSIVGALRKQTTDAGREYVGFENLGFAPRKTAPNSWGGHVFTADEKAKLDAGEAIYVEQLKAKSGNFYNATLQLQDDGEGGKKIVPSFGK